MKNNLKEKISNYGFWISILTVIFIIIQKVLLSFGIELQSQVIIEIIGGIIFILITVGVITNTKKEKLKEIHDDVKNEIENNNTNN